MCCTPWGHKESDTTERLNWNIFVRFHSVTDLSLPTEAEIGWASASASSFSLATEPFWLNSTCLWYHYFSWFVQMFWSHLVYPWPWMRTSHFSKKLWPLERRKGTSEPKSGCSEGHRPQSVVLRVFTQLKSLYETWVFILRCLWPFCYFCACLSHSPTSVPVSWLCVYTREANDSSLWFTCLQIKRSPTQVNPSAPEGS